MNRGWISYRKPFCLLNLKVSVISIQFQTPLEMLDVRIFCAIHRKDSNCKQCQAIEFKQTFSILMRWSFDRSFFRSEIRINQILNLITINVSFCIIRILLIWKKKFNSESPICRSEPKRSPSEETIRFTTEASQNWETKIIPALCKKTLLLDINLTRLSKEIDVFYRSEELTTAKF